MLRRPPWLKVKAFSGDGYQDIRRRLRGHHLHTVCEEANCPNRGECFNAGTATFLLMGPICSRNCRFCNVTGGKPQPLDPNEPLAVARLAADLGLTHVVITSVTRDDLPDEGAGHFDATVRAVQEICPKATIEILTPDFNGRAELLDIAVSARPTVFNHNVEVVPRLYPQLRPQADYQQSLDVLKYVAQSYPDIVVKSGIMVGLDETNDELQQLFADLAESGVKIITIGQYLPPTKKHYPLHRYYLPEEFDQLKVWAEAAGIETAVSGPLVRSSYRAAELVK